MRVVDACKTGDRRREGGGGGCVGKQHRIIVILTLYKPEFLLCLFRATYLSIVVYPSH